MKKEYIAKAVDVFRNSPNLGDQQILDVLVKDGLDRELAARLVEFLPMAYCRVVLGNSGTQFSNTFRRRLENGELREKSLSSEPVWQASLEFARSEAKSGIAGKDLLLVASHSAEFDVVNQLLNKGSKLTNLVLAAPILRWIEKESR
jgi:hypothetical protein